MTRKQEKFVRTNINIALEKNESYMPSSLGGRSISVDRQRDKIFVIRQLNLVNSKA